MSYQFIFDYKDAIQLIYDLKEDDVEKGVDLITKVVKSALDFIPTPNNTQYCLDQDTLLKQFNGNEEFIDFLLTSGFSKTGNRRLKFVESQSDLLQDALKALNDKKTNIDSDDEDRSRNRPRFRTRRYRSSNTLKDKVHITNEKQLDDSLADIHDALDANKQYAESLEHTKTFHFEFESDRDDTLEILVRDAVEALNKDQRRLDADEFIKWIRRRRITMQFFNKKPGQKKQFATDVNNEFALAIAHGLRLYDRISPLSLRQTIRDLRWTDIQSKQTIAKLEEKLEKQSKYIACINYYFNKQFSVVPMVIAPYGPCCVVKESHKERTDDGADCSNNDREQPLIIKTDDTDNDVAIESIRKQINKEYNAKEVSLTYTPLRSGKNNSHKFFISEDIIKILIAECKEPFDADNVIGLVLDYCQNNFLMQINDAQIRIFQTRKGPMCIVNIDLHFKSDGETIYLIATENESRYRESTRWRIACVKRADNICNDYGIKGRLLPKSSRQTKWFSKGLQTMPCDGVDWNHIINDTNWKELPVKKKLPVTTIKEDALKDLCHKFWDCAPILPVVYVKGRKQRMEWKKFMKIRDKYGKQQWFAVGLKYIKESKEWKIACLDYDAGRVYYQHRLVGHHCYHTNYCYSQKKITKYITTELNIV